MKNLFLFSWFFLLVNIAFGQTVINTDSVKIGKKGSSATKTISLGNSSVNPGIRYNSGTSLVELSNDGTNFYEAINSNTLANKTVNPNYVINGNFDFWQRGTGGTANNTYYADRFSHSKVGDTYVVSQGANPLDIPGFNSKYNITIAITSVAGASNYAVMEHRIEDVSRLAGKTLTYSFWAKSNVVGKKISLEFSQVFGTGGGFSSPVNVSGVTAITLTQNTWVKYSGTVTMPSISGKTLGTDQNSSFTQLSFWLDAGSTVGAARGNIGQLSGTVSIGQIKLEEGSVVTPFSLAGTTLAGELEMCQRYFEKSYSIDTAIGTATSVGSMVIDNSKTNDARGFQAAFFRARKRIVPTVNIYNTLAGTISSCSEYSSATARASAAQEPSEVFAFAWVTMTASAQPCRFQWTADADFY